MGDPAGVGPETIAAAWPALCAMGRVVVVGHSDVMRRAVALRGQVAEVVDIGQSEAADALCSEPARPDRMPCVRACDDAAAEVPAGVVDARGGQAAYDALLQAIELARSGVVDAITTTPLNKAALAAAGHRFAGHTEILAHACGVDDFAMMLYLPPGEALGGKNGLAAVHATLHVSLREAVERLSSRRIVNVVRLTDAAMRRIGGEAPRVGVCALNPHAGEEGLFGDEEIRMIAPAVQTARDEGIDVRGPFPADTLWARARAGEFDAVVCMYHDQGHIALKLLDMHRAVNITLGLPILRTSVAHGTAMDVAWQGVASPQSLIEAARLAARLARRQAATADNSPQRGGP